MEEFEIKPAVPRDVLVRDGTSAVVCLAGGISLLLITFGALPVSGNHPVGHRFCDWSRGPGV